MTTPAEILKPICSTDEVRRTILEPFGMYFEGRRWACATDGHICVAIAADFPLRKDAPDATVVFKPAPPLQRVSVPLLREWAGPVPAPPPPPSSEKRMVACDECNGKGTTTCPTCDSDDYDCDACDGTGKYEEDVDTTPAIEPRYGALLKGVLNRHLLARVLATLPADMTKIQIGQLEELAPYVLRAPNWIAAIMPVRGVDAKERFDLLEAA